MLRSSFNTSTNNYHTAELLSPLNSDGLGGQDRSGSPLSGLNCTSCHSGGSFGTSVTINLNDQTTGMPVTSYAPNTTYDLEIIVNASSGTPGGYGFQVTGLNTTNVQSGSYANPSSNAQIASSRLVEHDGTSATNTFTVEWTAPSAGDGSVTFYAAGNAVNGTGNTSGDQAALNNLTVTEATFSTGAFEVEQISIYPNPSRDEINISGLNEIAPYSIYNVLGAEVLRGSLGIDDSIGITGFERGLYFLHINDTVLKFMKN